MASSPDPRIRVFSVPRPTEKELAKIRAIFKKCEPEEATEGLTDATFVVLKQGADIVAFLVLQDLAEFSSESNFVEVGGIPELQGSLITNVCKDPDSDIKGVAVILLDFAMKENGYLLLHASVDRPHLEKVYTRAGFLRVGILPAGSLYDVDTVIYRKE